MYVSDRCEGMYSWEHMKISIIPQLIAALIAPVLALGMVVLGWIFMVGVAPFSMSYMIKSNKEGVHGKFFTVLGCICQFFFISDVIAIMILSLKEKKFVKLTVSLIIFYVILAFVFVVCLIAKIMLNENIKTLRKTKGLSQEELAIKLNVVRQTISKWENGLSVPDSSMILLLELFSHIKEDEMLHNGKCHIRNL